MQQLNQLIQEASSLAMPSAHVSEVHRVLQICNACRYCEGFCATFASMTRRLDFTPKDIHFMANLCHNCGACLHACQYAHRMSLESIFRKRWLRFGLRRIRILHGLGH